MKKLLLILILPVLLFAVSYTSNSSGDWSTTTIWTPNGTPGSGDTVTISSHDVAVFANTTIGAGEITGSEALTITGGGTLTIADDLKFTIRGDLRLSQGSLIMGAGDSLVFDGTYRVRYDNGTNQLNIAGLVSNNSVITTNSGYWWIINEDGSSSITTTINYCKFLNNGSSGQPGITIKGDYDAPGHKSWIWNYCLLLNYAGMRFIDFYSDTAQLSFYNCTFINSANTYILETNIRRSFEPGKRLFKNCVFIHPTRKNIRLRSVGILDNPVIFDSCITENITFDAGAKTKFCGFVHNNINTSSGLFTTNINSNDSVFLDDFVLASINTDNAHILSGNMLGVTNAEDGFIIDGELTLNPTEADLWLNGSGNGCVWNLERIVGINGSFATSLQATNYDININRCTHVVQYANATSSFFKFETNNPTGGSQQIKNSFYSLQVPVTTLNENWALSGPTNSELFFAEWNVVDSILFDSAQWYAEVTVTGKSWQDSGWDSASFSANIDMVDASVNIHNWDLSLGGSGSQQDAVNGLIKINGWDKTGAVATWDNDYNFTDLLVYLRNGMTPTDTRLQGTGEGGVDIGALDVGAAPTPTDTTTTRTKIFKSPIYKNDTYKNLIFKNGVFE